MTPKRIFDLTLVLATAPVWLLATAAAALLTLVGTGRPVLFRDERAGKDGKPFTLVKFRTMRAGEGSDAVRTTRIGAFMRKFSLDELPQLWLVLAGKMSLVGPRPLPVRYLPRYSPAQMRRHEVLPGITGFAQVNGRNTISWEEKFRYDVEYVDRHDLAMDVAIMAKTVFKAAGGADVNMSGEITMPEFNPQQEGAGQ